MPVNDTLAVNIDLEDQPPLQKQISSFKPTY